MKASHYMHKHNTLFCMTGWATCNEDKIYNSMGLGSSSSSITPDESIANRIKLSNGYETHETDTNSIRNISKVSPYYFRFVPLPSQISLVVPRRTLRFLIKSKRCAHTHTRPRTFEIFFLFFLNRKYSNNEIVHNDDTVAGFVFLSRAQRRMYLFFYLLFFSLSLSFCLSISLCISVYMRLRYNKRWLVNQAHDTHFFAKDGDDIISYTPYTRCRRRWQRDEWRKIQATITPILVLSFQHNFTLNINWIV